MKLKIKALFKNVKSKISRFYKQKELIQLKQKITTQIKRADEIIKKALEESNETVLADYLLERDKLGRDQKKIKLAISRNNFLLAVNKLIFKREEVTRLLKSYQSILNNKFSQEKTFVKEDIINKLQNILNKIDKRQNKRNNSFLTNSLLNLETI